jgi:hypothetical protein
VNVEENALSMKGLRNVALGFVLSLGLWTSGARADGFVKPTAEELAMTSLPGYPGAPAVVLFQEESTTDKLHAQ